MPLGTGSIMPSLRAYHHIFRSSWNVYLILQGHILRHGSGYTTSTVIGQSPCPRPIRRGQRLHHFIMPLCVVSVVSWSTRSLSIQVMSIAGVVLTRLRYMPPHSRDI